MTEEDFFSKNQATKNYVRISNNSDSTIRLFFEALSESWVEICTTEMSEHDLKSRNYNCRCLDLANCELFNPRENAWEHGPDMLRDRFNFLLANIPNRNGQDPDLSVPTVLGYGLDVEFWDPVTGNFVEGEDQIEDRNLVRSYI